MRTRLTGVVILTALVMFACNKGDDQKPQVAVANGHQVVVEEVIHTSAYTYLKVKEGGASTWLAVTKMDVEPGTTLYYGSALEMKNFESKELKRTFETVYFVDGISDQPTPSSAGQTAVAQHSKPVDDPQSDISVEKADGGISIAELFANRNAHANRKVKIRGQVTKYNGGIMGRNWVHLQDGTQGSGNSDITITTKDEVKVGDVVTLEGTVILNRDFGAGYAYEVIIENAKLLN